MALFKALPFPTLEFLLENTIEAPPPSHTKLTTSCKLWSRGLSRRSKDVIIGYGQIKRKGKTYRVHRLVYEFANNKKPGNLKVCHYCDRPQCINPDHLWLGTQKDNSNDKVAKNRHKQIERNKITADNVRDIKYFSELGWTITKIAAKYNVDRTYVGKILSNKRRKNII